MQDDGREKLAAAELMCVTKRKLYDSWNCYHSSFAACFCHKKPRVCYKSLLPLMLILIHVGSYISSRLVERPKIILRDENLHACVCWRYVDEEHAVM